MHRIDATITNESPTTTQKQAIRKKLSLIQYDTLILMQGWHALGLCHLTSCAAEADCLGAMSEETFYLLPLVLKTFSLIRPSNTNGVFNAFVPCL
jgi:hypothetical protein